MWLCVCYHTIIYKTGHNFKLIVNTSLDTRYLFCYFFHLIYIPRNYRSIIYSLLQKIFIPKQNTGYEYPIPIIEQLFHVRKVMSKYQKNQQILPQCFSKYHQTLCAPSFPRLSQVKCGTKYHRRCRTPQVISPQG